MASQFILLRRQRFAPLFVTQFLGAFNDNLFKTTLAVLIAYKVWDVGGWRPEVLVSLAAGLFILPYILMAPVGGSLADKYDKRFVIRFLKIFEIVIVAGVILGLWLQSVPFLFFILFLLGAQSALFSPSKYAIVPQHVGRGELIGANALLNTGTFIAILLGNILGSLWGVDTQGHLLAFAVLMICALVGFAASWYVPSAPAPDPGLKIKVNVIADIANNINYARAQHFSVTLALLGLAWFYFVGGTVLAQFPNFASRVLGVDNISLGIFMTVFTIGIALGGFLNNMLLKARVSARLVPAAAAGIALFTSDLALAGAAFHASVDEMNFRKFLLHPSSYRILFDILMMAVCGGLFVVPLNAILQDRANALQRARILSVSNVLDALFMFASSLIAVGIFALGFGVEHLFFATALATLLVAFYFYYVRQGFEEAHV